MAQILISIFFSLAAIGAIAMIVVMLRHEWIRISAILSGAELAEALAAAPRVRVRQRAWERPEPRLAPQRRAVAA
jgi:hypothetical protein